MKEYDITVIGAGSGGLVAALKARRHGARVALIERNKIGGECTHAGCVPSKTLISSARLYHAMKRADVHGLPKLSSSGDFDFARVMEHVDNVVQGVYQNEQPAHFQDLGIDVYIDPSGARFLSRNEIQIGKDVIRSNYAVISTGSSPRPAPRAGSEMPQFVTNDNFWALRKLPRSIAFLGGGVISAEIAQSLARFGSEVTIIERFPRILNFVDEEVGALAINVLKREGIRILVDSEVTNYHLSEGGQIKIVLTQQGFQREVFAEQIFAALGRDPNIAGLGLDRVGIAYSASGISTSEYLQTTVPNIYAIGDVTSPAKFTHIASYQAEVAVENILNGNQVKNDLSVVPWAIFMDPEIGHVGLTESEARRKGEKVNIAQVNTNSIDRFVTESATEGFLKVVMDENDVLLGADAIGVHAGEWIQFFTLAIQQKLPIQSLGDLIFIYPTFSEIIKKVVTRYLRNKTLPVPELGRVEVL